MRIKQEKRKQNLHNVAGTGLTGNYYN